MDADDPRLAAIKANVDFATAEFGELTDDPFGLDKASVAWVEGYIERMRSRMTEPPAGGLVAVLGSYLGQAIIAASDGQWDEDPAQGIGIKFASGDWCFPFAKVEKQFAEGLDGGESILGFYKVAVDYVAKGKLRNSDDAAE